MSDFAQSKLSLQPHIAAGRTKNSVVFSNPLTNREIAISGWTEPVSLLNSSSVLRAVLGRLSKANAQSLLHELRSASFLVDEVRIKTRQTTQRAWTVSLARAIASPYSI